MCLERVLMARCAGGAVSSGAGLVGKPCSTVCNENQACTGLQTRPLCPSTAGGEVRHRRVELQDRATGSWKEEFSRHPSP